MIVVVVVTEASASAPLGRVQTVVLVETNLPLCGQQKYYHDQVLVQLPAASMPGDDGADPSLQKPADNWSHGYHRRIATDHLWKPMKTDLDEDPGTSCCSSACCKTSDLNTDRTIDVGLMGLTSELQALHHL